MASDFPDVVSRTFNPMEDNLNEKYSTWFEQFKLGMMQKHGLNCKAILAHRNEMWTDEGMMIIITLEPQLVIDDL